MGLGTVDRRIFEAVAESDSTALDTVMPRLTAAADHSKLWIAIGAGLIAVRHPVDAARRGQGAGSPWPSRAC